jgi:hypothetical protein
MREKDYPLIDPEPEIAWKWHGSCLHTPALYLVEYHKVWGWISHTYFTKER